MQARGEKPMTNAEAADLIANVELLKNLEESSAEPTISKPEPKPEHKPEPKPTPQSTKFICHFIHTIQDQHRSQGPELNYIPLQRSLT